MNIDIEKLRYDLIEYFGTATSYNRFAVVDLIKVENASYYNLIQIAIRNGFNLDEYKLNSIRR